MPQPLWWNGQPAAPGTALVSVSSQGLQWGRGLFETVAVRDGRPQALSRHLRRFAAGAEHLHLHLPSSPVLRESIDLVLENCPPALHRLRLTLTGPALSGLDLQPVLGDLLIEATEVPEHHLRSAARLLTVPWRRNEHGALTGVKSTSYAENVIALNWATTRGATEALFLNTAGNLCEGSVTNLFLVRGGNLHTPPLSAGCLPGITRELVAARAGTLGIPCHETDFQPEEVQPTDHLFLTSSLRGIQPVIQWDHRTFPETCAITARLRESLREWLAETPDP